MKNDLIAFGLFLFFVSISIALPSIDSMIVDFSNVGNASLNLARTAFFLIGTGFLYSRVIA